MAVSKAVKEYKLSVSLKDANEESLGSRTISNCSGDADLDGYLTAGRAIQTLMGAATASVKKVTNYILIEE